jgi:hemolysin III
MSCECVDDLAIDCTGRMSAGGWDEEFLNGVTHAAGAVLSVAGSLVLLRLAVERGSLLHVVGCATYAGSLVTLYLASTLYHLARHEPLKQTLRVVDHVCIFLLIAGTYTPVSLVPLRGPHGWILLALVWCIAAAGAILKVTAADWAYGNGSTLLYAATCALGLPLLPQMIATFPQPGVTCVLAGSLAYAVGLVFFVRDDKPYFHAIWHLFVLAGSICHYLAILLAVIPANA